MGLVIVFTVAGVLSVVLAFYVLMQRNQANRDSAWPDDNPKADEHARRNVLRALTIGLIAFALLIGELSTQMRWEMLLLPLAAISLIVVAVVRLRLREIQRKPPMDRAPW